MDTTTATKSANQRAIGVEHAWNMPPLATRPAGATASHERDAIRGRVRSKLSRCSQPIRPGRRLPCNLHKFGGVERPSKA